MYSKEDFFPSIVVIDSFNQLTFTCSKSITKTLENGVKYVQS